MGEHQQRRLGNFVRALAAAIFLFLCGLSVLAAWTQALMKRGTPVWGATFSASYSQYLGSDWKKAYESILSDLKVQYLRLPVEWSSIEPEDGFFRWDDLDWMLERARESGATVTLVIGRKVPRWPECYVPSWTSSLPESQREERLLRFERAVVQRCVGHPSVKGWQVENEPALPFGACPVLNPGVLRREMETVRSFSDLPIALTVSGEWDPWMVLAPWTDHLGVSLYRNVWQHGIGFVTFPFPVWYYRLRASFSHLFGTEVFISELQAEPWFSRPFTSLSDKERAQAFSVVALVRNAEFASAVGTKEVSFWGVEWWYAEKEAGRPGLWNAARSLFVPPPTP